MKPTYVIKVRQEEPVHIEGTIHIRAKHKERALEKLALWGNYTVLDIKERE